VCVSVVLVKQSDHPPATENSNHNKNQNNNNNTNNNDDKKNNERHKSIKVNVRATDTRPHSFDHKNRVVSCMSTIVGQQLASVASF